MNDDKPMTATEVRIREEEARRAPRLGTAGWSECEKSLDCYRRWLLDIAPVPPPLIVMAAELYGKAVGEAMRKALAEKKARKEPDDERPTQKVTYVCCNTCFGSSEHSRFLFHGARIQSCKCKPGEEEWVKVDIEVPVAEPTVKGP